MLNLSVDDMYDGTGEDGVLKFVRTVDAERSAECVETHGFDGWVLDGCMYETYA